MLALSVPPKLGTKMDALNYIVIDECFFRISTQQMLANITNNINTGNAKI